jgi:hypothetical protein
MEVLAMRALYLKILSSLLVLIVPVALCAADRPAAMLYSHGTALLNGRSIARSSAIFFGDQVQTNADSAANINASGSIVLVLNDSLVEYKDDAVELEHGGISVSTSKLLATRAGDITVSPAASVWTEFEVRDVDGRVLIAARKGDLTISDESGTATLAQGEQTTREDSASQKDQDQDQDKDQDKKKKKRRKGAAAAPAAAEGGVFNSPIAVGIGGAAILGGALWVFVQGGEQPASPTR